MGELRRIFRSTITGEYFDRNASTNEATNLVYDLETKIVYYKFEGSSMSPYISKNGKFCRFDDGKIVEVN